MMNDNLVTQALNTLAHLGFGGLKAEHLSRLYNVDHYDEELTVMAETAAYFHIAYKVCPISISVSNRHMMLTDTACLLSAS